MFSQRLRKNGILVLFLFLSNVIFPEKFLSLVNFRLNHLAAECSTMVEEWSNIYYWVNEAFKIEGLAEDPNPLTNADPTYVAAIQSDRKMTAAYSKAYIQILKNAGVSKKILRRVRKYNGQFLRYAFQFSLVFNINNTQETKAGDEQTIYNNLLNAGKNLAEAFKDINPNTFDDQLYTTYLSNMSIYLSQLPGCYRGLSGYPPVSDVYGNIQLTAQSIASLLNSAVYLKPCQPL